MPSDWTRKPFADVADYSTGRTPARANPAFWEGDDNSVPWVAISDMDEYGTVTGTKETITSAAFAQVFRGRCSPAGTLLMSFKLTIGRVATLGVDACHNEAIISIYPKAGIDQRYLGYWLSQVDYDDLQDRQIKGHTLNQDKIDRIPVAVPDLGEQESIADVLDGVRLAIRLEADALAFSNELKRATMRELFTRGLCSSETQETEFGPIPLGWSVDTLDHNAFIQTGAAKGRKFADPDTVEIPYLRVANVQDGHLDLSEMKTIQIRRNEIERFRLKDGDVVLTEGGDFDKLGRGFIWRGELDLCVHQNHVFAVRTERSRILPEFFAYQAQSPYGKAYFLKVAHKTTNLACINSTKLKAFPVLIPPSLDEQRKIVAILGAIDTKIDLHKRKRELLEELFRALLNKLMTGEIAVSDLNLAALETAAA